MDSGSGGGDCSVVPLLLLLSFFCLHLQSALAQTQTQTTSSAGSVLFIDSPTHHYLRTSSHHHQPLQLEANLMSAMEVGAAVSILLGLAPPPMLSTASSAKLNELLMPNPFDRPRHVFMLEIALAKDSLATVYPNGALSGSTIMRKVISSSSSVQIELPDREEVSFFPLNGSDDSYKSITDKEISDFAQSFGGSYISDDLEALTGELIIPLPSGLKMNMHLSKKADREFVTGLIDMIENIRKVIGMTRSNVAELVGGYFEGIKALQEEYGSKDVSLQAMELLLATVSKVFDSLHAECEGQIVGVILFNKVEFKQSQKILDVTFDTRPSPRWLKEVNTTSNSTTVSEMALVRITLAWTTGIVLIIATIIGVYLLVNMPLTRDTLLYSNVKLD